ncbi:MAG: tRNA pseudouridine(38-40) synthase TruA [Puniceicoccales bacterium]|jgi:tRNA pseudouridine38-40 synthase|nr:tRNA pseudouridine(38-40) synthase TruA [Puniceicoccales bacterium]
MRWKCECQYDGTDFYGWQSQPNGNTIQDFIERRLAVIFGKTVRIHGSGRTDAGVHARGQIFHFDGDWYHGSEKLLRAFRSGLPSGIQITKVEETDSSFHARYSVKKKRYIYQIYLGYASPFERRYKWSIGERVIDLQRMNDLARYFLGRQDFSAFGALRGDGSTDDPVKNLYQLSFSLKDRDLVLETEGSGYLYKMVRTLTATLLDVGLGRTTKDYVLDCFFQKIRREKIVTAPPQGLFLEQVFTQ